MMTILRICNLMLAVLVAFLVVSSTAAARPGVRLATTTAAADASTVLDDAKLQVDELISSIRKIQLDRLSQSPMPLSEQSELRREGGAQQQPHCGPDIVALRRE